MCQIEDEVIGVEGDRDALVRTAVIRVSKAKVQR
jgi:hypothetical protein